VTEYSTISFMQNYICTSSHNEDLRDLEIGKSHPYAGKHT